MIRFSVSDFAGEVDVTGDGNRVIDLRFMAPLLKGFEGPPDTIMGRPKLFDFLL